MRWFFIIGLLSIFLISCSSAITFYVPQGSDYDLKISCAINGAMCSSSAWCNITAVLPNSTIIINNAAMTNLNNGYFNYTLDINETNTKGEYSVRVECRNGGLNDTTNFIYEVNPAGIRPSDQRTSAITRSIYYIFGIALVLFVAFIIYAGNITIKWTFLLASVMLFLVGINIIFVSMQDEIVNPAIEGLFDFLVAISFYMYWFVGTLIFLMWMVTLFNTILSKKQADLERKYG